MKNRQIYPSMSDAELLQEFKEREAETRRLIGEACFLLCLPKGLEKLEAAQREINRTLEVNRQIIKRGVTL